jgi:hypothetical protein
MKRLEFKRCSRCKKTETEVHFSPSKHHIDGATNWCNLCQREYYLKNKDRINAKNKEYQEKNKDRISKQRKEFYKKNSDRLKEIKMMRVYGIGMEDFARLLNNQNNACAVCKTKNPIGNGFCVDHDHKTGVIRGILCPGCNTAIGLMRDDPQILQSAISYLEQICFLPDLTNRLLASQPLPCL